jgi:hypothetical protein
VGINQLLLQVQKSVMHEHDIQLPILTNDRLRAYVAQASRISAPSASSHPSVVLGLVYQRWSTIKIPLFSRFVNLISLGSLISFSMATQLFVFNLVYVEEQWSSLVVGAGLGAPPERAQ